MSGRSRTVELDHDVWIDRPAPEVFAYVSDPGNLADFEGGIRAARYVGPGRGEGARIEAEVSFLGAAFDKQSERTEFVPGVRYRERALHGMPIELQMTLEPRDGGTYLRRQLRMETEGFAAGLDPSNLAAVMDCEGRATVAKIKALIERGAAS